MDMKQISGCDCYGFPEQSKIGQMLFWMGDHYLEYIVREVVQRISGEVIAVKCEKFPDFNSTIATNETKRLKSICAEFSVQILTVNNAGNHVRIHATYRAQASNLLAKPDYLSDLIIDAEESL